MEVARDYPGRDEQIQTTVYRLPCEEDLPRRMVSFHHSARWVIWKYGVAAPGDCRMDHADRGAQIFLKIREL